VLKTDLIMLQPTPFCNINCSYCYLPNRTSNKRMSSDVLRSIFTLLFSSDSLSDPISMVWHCGEPMALPVNFYEEAFAIQDEVNNSRFTIKNAFQTNATLITPNWCKFIRQHSISMGVSVDGPAFLHDQSRVDRQGRGTHDATLRGMKMLQAHGIPFHVLSVLTRESLKNPDAVWRFLKDQNIKKVGFNCEEIEGINTNSSLLNREVEDLYKSFFRRLLFLRAEEQHDIEIRETDTLIRFITHNASEMRSSENTALKIVSVDYSGGISTFSPELLGMEYANGSFVFANTKSDGLAAVLENESFQEINRDILSGVARCRAECDHFKICGGGAPSNKYYENKTFDSTETMACRLRIKALSEVVFDYMESPEYVHVHGSVDDSSRWP
jgi:uncharacterized protein